MSWASWRRKVCRVLPWYCCGVLPGVLLLKDELGELAAQA